MVPPVRLELTTPALRMPSSWFGAGDGDALTAFLVHSPFRPKSKTPPTHWIDGIFGWLRGPANTFTEQIFDGSEGPRRLNSRAGNRLYLLILATGLPKIR